MIVGDSLVGFCCHQDDEHKAKNFEKSVCFRKSINYISGSSYLIYVKQASRFMLVFKILPFILQSIL